MLTCTPDVGVPLLFEDNATYSDLYTKAKAACSTYETLAINGLTPFISDKDKIEAQNVLCAIADPTIPAKNASQTLKNPASVASLYEILTEFDKKVVESAVQLRTYVTNRLIIESNNPDARIRIKALELLGRISDVGLFTERAELTVTHRATSDIESRLRDKLNQLITSAAPDPTLDVAVIDVDTELGLAHTNAN